MKLTQKQKKHLKALAHPRKPVVMVGQHGITPAVITELDGALEHHQLLKVKIAVADRDSRSAMINKLCQQTQAQCIQTVGHIAVLFRPDKDPARSLFGAQPPAH